MNTEDMIANTNVEVLVQPLDSTNRPANLVEAASGAPVEHRPDEATEGGSKIAERLKHCETLWHCKPRFGGKNITFSQWESLSSRLQIDQELVYGIMLLLGQGPTGKMEIPLDFRQPDCALLVGLLIWLRLPEREDISIEINQAEGKVVYRRGKTRIITHGTTLDADSMVEY